MRSTSATAASGARTPGPSADVLRQVKRVTHDARQLGHAAGEAIETGREAAVRAVRAARRGYRNAIDFRDETAYRVKREPLKAIGLAFAVGLLAGCVTEKIRAACRHPERNTGR